MSCTLLPKKPKTSTFSISSKLKNYLSRPYSTTVGLHYCNCFVWLACLQVTSYATVSIWKCICPACSEQSINRFLSLLFVVRCVSCGTPVGRFRKFPGIHGLIEAFLILGSVLGTITILNPIPLLVGTAVFVLYKHTMPLKPAKGDSSRHPGGPQDSDSD